MQTKYFIVRHKGQEEPTCEFRSESLTQSSKYFIALAKNCKNNFDTLELLRIEIIPSFFRISQLIYVGKNLNPEPPKPSIKGGWHT